MNISVTKKDRLSAAWDYGSNGSTPNLFGFVDTSTGRSVNANIGWTHNINTHLINSCVIPSAGLAASRRILLEQDERGGSTRITGVSTAPINWGPPNLSFTSGINGLSDGAATLSRNQTSAVGESLIFVHNTHNFTFAAISGGSRSIPCPTPMHAERSPSRARLPARSPRRGTAGTGFDFADFLLAGRTPAPCSMATPTSTSAPTGTTSS